MDGDNDLRTGRGLVVPAHGLIWTFARSSGAGGQHINKTSTKVTLTVAVEAVLGPPRLIERIRAALPAEIRVTDQTTRSQWRNRQACLERVAEMIDEAAKPPEAPRRASKPTRGSVERRLASKKRESDKKQDRRTTQW